MQPHDLPNALNAANAIGDPEQRAEALRRVCERHPRAAVAWFNYAGTLLDAGRPVEARSALLRSLALDAAQMDLAPPRLRALLGEVAGRSRSPAPATPTTPAAVPLPPASGAWPPPAGWTPAAGSRLPPGSPTAAEPGWSPSSAAGSDRPEGALTVVDPVESRLGRSVGRGLVLEQVLARSPGQALFVARAPDGARLARLLLEVPAALARAVFRRELALPAVDGLARALEVVDDRGQPLLVYRPLPGQPLRARLAAGPLPLSEAVELVRAVAQLLESLLQHRLEIEELDPDSIFWEPQAGAVSLLGAGEAIAPEQGMGTRVALAGRPPWLAPDEDGDPADRGRRQVRQLGALLVAALAGGESAPAWGRGRGGPEATLAQLPAAAASLAEATGVLRLTRRCLSLRALDRPASPGELASELAALAAADPRLRRSGGGRTIHQEPPAARADPRRRRQGPPGASPRRALPLWAKVLALSTVVGAGFGLLLQLLWR